MEIIRDQKVAIFVPSKYGSGQPIRPEDRQNQIRVVAGKLAKLFGGASAEAVASSAKRIVGTYQHGVDGSGRVVDEEVFRVWTAVTARDLEDADRKTAVAKEAHRLRDELRQESVLYEWGRSIYFTDSATQPAAAVHFGSLPRGQQEQFALMAWHRVAEPEDLAGVLSLAGWQYPTNDHPGTAGLADRSKIAWHGERVAWWWRPDNAPPASELRKLRIGDLLIMKSADSRIRVWLRTKEGIAGPRAIPLATDSRPTTRLAIEFVIALLDGTGRFSLAQLLDAEGATARFYNDVRKCIRAVAQAVFPADACHANAVAQRLIGRLLFVRFVEEKGWLPEEHLLKAWHDNQGPYYRSVLVPLFEALNTPQVGRRDDSRVVPYLNGGLFEPRSEDAIDLDDKLFDPSRGPSGILGLLYHYQFTLDEAAGREDVVSVDPAMLGRVLESLTPDQARKFKGVHYTPAPIARALAAGGILPQLVRRAKQKGIPGVDESTLARVCAGDPYALSAAAAEELQKELRALRIVDPAVGSGALLVACLDVLLDIETGCERVLGGDLRRGSHKWAERARHFVRECLFGVDISQEAVEVARLRFWLYLAVGEQSATALPDLGYNLRVGDSLGFDRIEQRLMIELAKRDGQTRTLEFDEIDGALNDALEARRRFAASAGAPAAERSASFRDLERAERQLRLALGGEPGSSEEAPPFAWALHFPEVFQGANRGFDLVIANPPYVRTSSLTNGAELKKRYRSMRSKNVDLYYAFVERCFRAPVMEDDEDPGRRGLRGLAGKAGSVAFILPSFAQTTSAENLRELLADGGHVERWVDFRDQQVFPTATNYVALLFATAERRDRRTFRAQEVTPEAFSRMRANEPWLETLAGASVPYATGGWDVRPQPQMDLSGRRALGDIATVQVGIQTSLDSFYLLNLVRPADDPTLVIVRNSGGDELLLEKAALFPCAKGSRDLHGAHYKQGCYVLWPYDRGGALLSQAELEAKFPLAWAYLLGNRSILQSREKGRFADSAWWRFRRPQGVRCATQPKILVPSMMIEPTAYYDREGAVICTASGKGGGGGWVIQPGEGTTLQLEQLADYLCSAEHFEWLKANAEPKKGGWLGIDRKTLERCPVPL